MKFKVVSFAVLLGFMLINNLLANTSNNTTEQQAYLASWDMKERQGASPLYSLAPYDSKAAKSGNLKPIILIHGTISEFAPYCKWDYFLEEWESPRYSELRQNYALYIFRYPSTVRLWDTPKNKLKTALEELLQHYPKESKLRFVVSSLGGNLLLSLMKTEPALLERTEMIISLGTPFEGVPVFPAGEKQSTTSNSNDFLNDLLLKSTDLFFPVLKEQLSWKPPENLEFLPDQLSSSVEKEFKAKLITYAAFIDSPLSQSKACQEQKIAQDWLWENLSPIEYKHSWNVLIHYKMAWELKDKIKACYLLRFNDGLVPIYSALWLEKLATKVNSSCDDLDQEILSLIRTQNPRARIFKGFEHSDFNHKPNSSKQVYDFLQQEHKPSINAFIIEDLI